MNVKILKNNSIYRISDIILRRGIRWEQDRKSVLTLPQYKGSILFDYLKKKKQENDFQTLKQIIWQHIREKRYPTAKSSELVVHMRLGDITEVPSRHNECKNAYNNFYKKLPISSININEVTLVTALHFGANEINGKYFYSELAKENSLKIIEEFSQQTKNVGLPLNIRSNENPDVDFVYMASSQYFVKGKTLLSNLVSHCMLNDSTTYEV